MYDLVKGRDSGGLYSLKDGWNALEDALAVFGEGHVSTHFIVGLRESDHDLGSSTEKVVKIGITPSLFAYTPIPGTTMAEHAQAPPLERYRALQVMRELLVNCRMPLETFSFNDTGKMVGMTEEGRQNARESIERVFLTQGCPDCNRPFYNERPRGPMYNYPAVPEDIKLEKAFKEFEHYLRGE